MNVESSKQKWESAYSKEREHLPWLENPIPEKIIEQFCSHFNLGDKVLDYGCGDGILSEILVKKGLKVVCSDISQRALDMVLEKIPGVETIQASEPLEIGNTPAFEGVIVWGVMHHIDKKLWGNYLDGFANLIKENGRILIGGHSMKDEEFAKGFRVSPTTGLISNAVDSLETLLVSHKLKIIDSDYFPFEEGFSKKQRVFKYFIAEKNN